MSKQIQLKNGDERVYPNPFFPVGAIYMSVTSTNPSTYFGGTWVAWGSGRVPVGINTSDSDFNTTEKTGGSKSLKLKAEMGSFDGNINKIGFAATGKGASGFTYGGTWNNTESNIANSRVNHGVSVVDETAGNSTSVSKLQPYITCYMWKRTA